MPYMLGITEEYLTEYYYRNSSNKSVIGGKIAGPGSYGVVAYA